MRMRTRTKRASTRSTSAPSPARANRPPVGAMELTKEEQAMLAGQRGEAIRKAIQYQLEVGKFWGAKKFVPVTNVHMMGDIEVMGDGGLEWLQETAKLGAKCVVGTTTNAR